MKERGKEDGRQEGGQERNNVHAPATHITKFHMAENFPEVVHGTWDLNS